MHYKKISYSNPFYIKLLSVDLLKHRERLFTKFNYKLFCTSVDLDYKEIDRLFDILYSIVKINYLTVKQKENDMINLIILNNFLYSLTLFNNNFILNIEEYELSINTLSESLEKINLKG